MNGRRVLWTACFLVAASVLVMVAGSGCERVDERDRTYYEGRRKWCMPGACEDQYCLMFVDAFDRVWPGIYPIPRGHDDDEWQSAGNPGTKITTSGKPKKFTIVIKAPTQTMTYKGGVSGSKMTGTFHVDTVNAGSGDGTFDCTENPSKS